MQRDLLKLLLMPSHDFVIEILLHRLIKTSEQSNASKLGTCTLITAEISWKSLRVVIKISVSLNCQGQLI
jgi:hypothetical protein